MTGFVMGALMATGMLFPTVSGDNLAGRRYELPADFDGQANIVLIAFKRGQQEQVNPWLEPAVALEDSLAGVRAYELPTLATGWKLMRPVIDGGMRSGIPDPEARRRTITLYTDKPAFLEALEISSDEEVQVLLVDGEGRVRWRSHGEATPGKLATLEKAVRELLASAEAGGAGSGTGDAR